MSPSMSKVHLRIQQDEEDTYLAGLIAQAQAAAEDFCRVSFEETAPEPVRLPSAHGRTLLENGIPGQGGLPDHAHGFENLLYPYRDLTLML